MDSTGGVFHWLPHTGHGLNEVVRKVLAEYDVGLIPYKSAFRILKHCAKSVHLVWQKQVWSRSLSIWPLRWWQRCGDALELTFCNRTGPKGPECPKLWGRTANGNPKLVLSATHSRSHCWGSANPHPATVYNDYDKARNIKWRILKS